MESTYLPLFSFNSIRLLGYTGMQCLNGVLSMHGTLGSRAKELRTRFFICVVAGMSATLMGLTFSIGHDIHHPAYMIGTVLVVAAFSVATCAVLCGMHLNTVLVVGTLYVVTSGVLLWDLNARTIYTEKWPLLVIVVDMLLVMQVPTRYSQGLMVFIVLWLVVLGLEESFRFGLFDLPGLSSQQGPHGRGYVVRERFDCVAQPCPVPFPSAGLIGALCVFVIDFMVTRGFAHRVLMEQDSMERTISAVQEIASAGYDVENVAVLLEAHQHELPEGMTVALRRLEHNLRLYKAYLPATCLQFEEVDSSEDTAKSTQSSGTSSFHSKNTGSESSAHPSARLSTITKPEAFRRVLGLASAKATLLTVNIKDTLRLVEKDMTRFSDLFTAVLLETLEATATRCGMVDVFVGDRVHCSFNASRKCANHATSALHAATTLRRGSAEAWLHINIGIASGKLVRGDMGESANTSCVCFRARWKCRRTARLRLWRSLWCRTTLLVLLSTSGCT